MDDKLSNFFTPLIKDGDLENYINWLKTTPKLTTYRINTLTHNLEILKCKIETYLEEQRTKYKRKYVPKVITFFSEVITIECWPEDDNKEGCYNHSLQDVIVDASCGSAVLRGANVFAPAVMGLPPNVKPGDCINIFADVSGNCKRGLKLQYLDGEKVYVGLGKLKMHRKQLFNTNNVKPRGVAIEMIMPQSRVPVIDHSILPEGSCLLQNLPSIICSKVLQPQPGECVIDLCSAPGNKTTHLAQIMQDEGVIIALDKVASKINLMKTQYRANYKSIHAFTYDSTKVVSEKTQHDETGFTDVLRGPPFLPEIFDRVLLDAPCSVLGQRPLLKIPISEKCLKSFVPLQRKLFYSAVNLLKSKGRLVYSTCTVTSQECEEMVSWALNTFDCLKLVPAEPLLGNPGWRNCGLDDRQRIMVQRFGPEIQDVSRNSNPDYCINDTIGFFIACFTKN